MEKSSINLSKKPVNRQEFFTGEMAIIEDRLCQRVGIREGNYMTTYKWVPVQRFEWGHYEGKKY